MSYTPDPNNAAEPVASRRAGTAAAEFRALKAEVNRSVRAPVAESAVGRLPTVANRAGRVFAWDAAGNPTTLTVSGTTDPSLRADLADGTDITKGAALVASRLNATGAAVRSLRAKLADDAVSFLDFDGATNEAKIGAALDYLISIGGGTLFIPAGVHRVRARIVRTISAKQHINIVGLGRYVSVLDFSDGASLGIHFNSTTTAVNQKPCFEFRDFGLITSADNCGTAIQIDFADSLNLDAAVTVHDLLIAQNLARTSDTGTGFGYWSTGIRLFNARNSEIRNLHFFGEMNKPNPTAQGVYLLGESTAVVISDSLLLEAVTLIEAAGTCEGLYVHATDVLYGHYGIYHNIATGAEPQCTVTDSSINCSHVGVWLHNVQQSVVANCLFYAAAELHGAGPWPEWRGILISGANSRYNTVANCVFSKNSTRTSDVTNGIDLAAGKMYSISGNRFFGFSGNTLTTGIQVRSGVTDVVITADNLFEFVSNLVDNSGTRAQRDQVTISGRGVFATGATITFPGGGFLSPPTVVATHEGTDTSRVVIVFAVSATSFVVNFPGGGSIAISWIASGAV